MSARIQRVENKNGNAVGETLLLKIERLECENVALREALQNCSIAASGQNWQQIAWIVESALSQSKRK